MKLSWSRSLVKEQQLHQQEYEQAAPRRQKICTDLENKMRQYTRTQRKTASNLGFLLAEISAYSFLSRGLIGCRGLRVSCALHDEGFETGSDQLLCHNKQLLVL